VSSKNYIGLVVWCFLLIKSKNYILLKDYFQAWTYNDQQIPLQHNDSLYFIACRNAMGFRCILRLVAEMKMLKYPRIENNLLTRYNFYFLWVKIKKINIFYHFPQYESLWIVLCHYDLCWFLVVYVYVKEILSTTIVIFSYPKLLSFSVLAFVPFGRYFTSIHLSLWIRQSPLSSTRWHSLLPKNHMLFIVSKQCACSRRVHIEGHMNRFEFLLSWTIIPIMIVLGLWIVTDSALSLWLVLVFSCLCLC
jgi:hypothetical protein